MFGIPEPVIFEDGTERNFIANAAPLLSEDYMPYCGRCCVGYNRPQPSRRSLAEVGREVSQGFSREPRGFNAGEAWGRPIHQDALIEVAPAQVSIDPDRGKITGDCFVQNAFIATEIRTCAVPMECSGRLGF